MTRRLRSALSVIAATSVAAALLQASTGVARASTGPVVAYTQSTAVVGSGSGDVHNLNCPQDSALAAMTLIGDNKGLDQAGFGAGVQISCAPLTSDGNFAGPVSPGPTALGPNTKGASPHLFPTACPTSDVAVGALISADTYVHGLGLSCAPIQGGVPGTPPTLTAVVYSTNGDTTAATDRECPQGQFAIGIDAYINLTFVGAAVRCGTVSTGFAVTNVQVTTSTPQVDPGATDVPTSRIPVSDLPAAAADAVASAPLRSVPLRSVPLRSVPLRSVPLRSVPLRSVPLASVLLSQVPLTGTSWEQLLAGTPLANSPLESVTLDQALAALDAIGSNAPTMDQVDLSQTPLRDISVASIFLGSSGIGSLPIPGTTTSTLPTTTTATYNNWCDWITSLGYDCASLGLTASSPVLSADLAGVPLRSVPLRSVPLRSVPTDAPLRSVPLRSVDWQDSALGGILLSDIAWLNDDGTPTAFGSIPISSIPSSSPLAAAVQTGSGSLPTGVVQPCDPTSSTCPQTLADAIARGQIVPGATLSLIASVLTAPWTLADLGTVGSTTVGDLANDLRTDSITLGDILLALMPPDAVPWESLPLDGLDMTRYQPSPSAAQFTASLDLTGSGGSAAGNIWLQLPAGFRYVGKASFTGGDGSTSLGTAFPVGQDGTSGAADPSNVVFSLTNVTVPAHVSVTFTAVAPTTLGTESVAAVHASFTTPLVEGSATAFGDGTEIDTGVTVHNPDGGAPGDGRIIQPGHLVFGYVSQPGASTYFRLAVPAAGTHVHVLLSHLPADDDLVVYGPPDGVSQPNSTPLRSVPLRSVQIPDDGVDANNTSSTAPQTLNDVPLLPNLPVAAESAHSGTDMEEGDTLSVDSLTAAGSYYTIQVTGYNGATSNQPFMLRVVEDSPVNETCPSLGHPGYSVSGSLPVGNSTTRSLFLVNVQQMKAEYDPTAVNAMLASLNSFVARPDVAGLVVPVDADTGVVAAYNTWNQDPCSSAAADGVVNAVNALVRSYKSGSARFITSVTLVGADSQLPMYRTPDMTLSANESGYAETDRNAAGAANPLAAAQAHGDMLTDDNYGTLAAIPWLDRRLYLPDLAVGRLVETPAEIQGQLQQFIDGGGRLTPSSALTTGYDFLSDGATAVDAALGADGVSNRNTLINSTWTRSDLNTALFPSTGSPFVDSINAHFDHNRALPSVGNTTGTESDLFTVADITAHPDAILGRILFSMGCHAGLNVPDSYVGAGTQVAKDWAQTFAASRAIWVANTGFGLGDTATVALSERLMQLFAQHLDGTLLAGQALQFAKQGYFSDLGAYGVYDEKAMEEPVFYGLPMWRVGGARWDPPASGQPAAPVPPLQAWTPPADPAGTTASSPSPSVDNINTAGIGLTRLVTTPWPGSSIASPPSPVTTSRGQYWSAGGGVQVTHYRPIQPRTYATVTPSTGVVHGSLITALQSTDLQGVDPVYARPTIDLAANEPEASFNGSVFPTQLETLTSFTRQDGQQETRLVMLPGQFFGTDGTTDGTQRLYLSMTSDVLTSSDTTHFDAPLLTNAKASVPSPLTAQFDVDVVPVGGAQVATVLVMLHDSNGWSLVPLSNTGGNHYSGTHALGGTAFEWFAEAADSYGNTGTTNEKGGFFGTSTAVKVSVKGQKGLNGWYVGDVSIDVTGPASSYTIVAANRDDNSAVSVTDTSLLLNTDGRWEVTVSGTDGTNKLIGSIKIDKTQPSAVIQGLNSSGVLSVSWDGAGAFSVLCTDSESGVADCPGTSTTGSPVTGSAKVTTATIGTGTVSFTIHDVAGHAFTTDQVPYVVQPVFQGYLSPINDAQGVAKSAFKYGSTIPVKFQLTDANGVLMSDSVAQSIVAQQPCGARLWVSIAPSSSTPSTVATYSDPSDTAGCFRYDATAHQFVYNLGTKTITGGQPGQTWTLETVVSYLVNGSLVVLADHSTPIATG
jgi:hypothetical protein